MAGRRYAGIYPVLYAFWDAEGRLDREPMRAQVEHCIDAGAHGITVLGLVTEVHKMDVNERLRCVEMVGELIDGRVSYAVTVGEPSLQGQISFARAAQSFLPLFHSVARASRTSNGAPDFPHDAQKTVDSIFSNY